MSLNISASTDIFVRTDQVGGVWCRAPEWGVYALEGVSLPCVVTISFNSTRLQSTDLAVTC